MGVTVGIVIESGNPAHEGFAKVRIPSIHGLPLTDTLYNQLIKKYEKIVSTKNTTNNLHNIKQYSLAAFGSKQNIKVVNDEDVPWYPIIYPFGSNISPDQFSLVYVIDNAYIIGWANELFYPEL